MPPGTKLPCSARLIAAVALTISGDWQSYTDLQTATEEILGQAVSVAQLRRALKYLEQCGAPVDRDISFRRRSGADPQRTRSLLEGLVLKLCPSILDQGSDHAATDRCGSRDDSRTGGGCAAVAADPIR